MERYIKVVGGNRFYIDGHKEERWENLAIGLWAGILVGAVVLMWVGGAL